jgi:nucleoside-diphosphate-sugar epimerase
VFWNASSAVFCLWRNPDAAQARIYDPRPNFALRRRQAGQRTLSDFFCRCYQLETVALRYFNIFGPRQDPSSPYSGVLAKFITIMLRGERPAIYGDGEQSRDFTYIDNAIEANLLACKAPAAERGGDNKHSLADISKAEAALGYKPKVDFEEGLRRNVGWYGGNRFEPAQSNRVRFPTRATDGGYARTRSSNNVWSSC